VLKLDRKLIIIIMIIIAVFACVFFLLTSPSKTVSNSEKLNVIVTVPPQADFVKAVGGERVAVTVMVPTGADPHTYEPLPQQMQNISKAQVYLSVGTPLEFELTYLSRIKELNPSLKVYNTSTGILLTPEGNSQSLDPHVWVSPKNAKIMVNNTYEALVASDPVNQAYYQANRDLFLTQLDELDQNITQSLQGVSNKKIMVFHPAWGYLARDYGIEQIAIQGEGKEPTSQQIAQLIEKARQDNITVIFVSPQFSQKSAEVISSEIGGKVVAVDPLAENYIENMKKVVDAFREAME
jgi:zinc transport system substrate-binding protein